MSKPGGKVTYKELNDRMSMFYDRITQMHQNMDYIHTLVLKYIAFKDDEKAFLEFVNKQREKTEKKAREDEGQSE